MGASGTGDGRGFPGEGSCELHPERHGQCVQLIVRTDAAHHEARVARRWAARSEAGCCWIQETPEPCAPPELGPHSAKKQQPLNISIREET